MAPTACRPEDCRPVEDHHVAGVDPIEIQPCLLDHDTIVDLSVGAIYWLGMSYCSKAYARTPNDSMIAMAIMVAHAANVRISLPSD